MKFLVSFFIWEFIFFPVVLLSFLIVPILCLTKWDGTTTWFGNSKYGRGDTHYKAPSEGKYWKQLNFLCIRNPISNFGKQVLSVKETNTWAWLEDKQIYKNFYWMYGWKNPVDGMRTYVFRPWLK